MKNNRRDITFSIFSAIGMILVMLGHLDYGILTIGGLFPYYSFHVLIFVFISGYFYKPEAEDSILSYIVHKAKTLLLPYFVWNVIYGMITLIMHMLGFTIGDGISVYTLLIAPFVGGHHFMYNATAWFVPALFMLEIINVIGRKILSCIRIRNEWIIAILYLLVGCFAVYMAKRGSVYDYYKIPGRLMVMAPAFALGRLYNVKLKEIDRVPSLILLPFLMIINGLLGATHGGLAYSVVWVTGFANTPLTPFITMATGIWFWLRISSLIAAVAERDKEGTLYRFFDFFGANTYSVMMHHLMIFMGIKAVFAGLSSSINAFSDFNFEQFYSDVYYTYTPLGIEATKLIYLILGVAGSLLIARVIKLAGERINEGKN